MKATETYYENKIAKLEAAIQRVRELHKPDPGTSDIYCSECVDGEGLIISYPCPTIKALDGEE